MLQSGLVLLGSMLSLTSFLGFGHLDRLNDFFSLLLIIDARSVVLLGDHFLLKFPFLLIEYFLLNSVIIPLLQAHDIRRFLLRLFNFLPCAHFLLLQEGNTVSQHIRILFNTTTEEQGVVKLW